MNKPEKKHSHDPTLPPQTAPTARATITQITHPRFVLFSPLGEEGVDDAEEIVRLGILLVSESTWDLIL